MNIVDISLIFLAKKLLRYVNIIKKNNLLKNSINIQLLELTDSISEITHYEDAEFSPCDLHDEISNAIFEYAYKLF